MIASEGTATTMTNNFHFDRIIERRGTGAIKWDSVPNDVIPMWVADMDFPAPPPVIDALRARLDHPVFGYARRRARLPGGVLEMAGDAQRLDHTARGDSTRPRRHARCALRD